MKLSDSTKKYEGMDYTNPQVAKAFEALKKMGETLLPKGRAEPRTEKRERCSWGKRRCTYAVPGRRATRFWSKELPGNT